MFDFGATRRKRYCDRRLVNGTQHLCKLTSWLSQSLWKKRITRSFLEKNGLVNFTMDNTSIALKLITRFLQSSEIKCLCTICNKTRAFEILVFITRNGAIRATNDSFLTSWTQLCVSVHRAIQQVIIPLWKLSNLMKQLNCCTSYVVYSFSFSHIV